MEELLMKIKKFMQILAIGLAMLMGVETATEVANINPTAHTVQAARRRYRRRRRCRVLDRTKIYTSTRPVIIGNRRSHIYHVYRQHAYRMNRGNAVYFRSEAAARAAGYRKSYR